LRKVDRSNCFRWRLNTGREEEDSEVTLDVFYKINKVDEVWTPYDAVIFQDRANIGNEG
jgi:cobalamin biosynthesis protein CbiG